MELSDASTLRGDEGEGTAQAAEVPAEEEFLGGEGEEAEEEDEKAAPGSESAEGADGNEGAEGADGNEGATGAAGENDVREEEEEEPRRHVASTAAAAAEGKGGSPGERRRKTGRGLRKGRGGGRGRQAVEEAGHESTGETLYVSNLDPNVKSKLLKDEFQKFGPMGECRIVVNPVSKESRRFAFLRFASAEAADQALEEMNGHVIMGQAICVERAKRNKPHNPTPGQYRGPSGASVKYDFNGRLKPGYVPYWELSNPGPESPTRHASSGRRVADGFLHFPRGLSPGWGSEPAQVHGYGPPPSARFAPLIHEVRDSRVRRGAPRDFRPSSQELHRQVYGGFDDSRRMMPREAYTGSGVYVGDGSPGRYERNVAKEFRRRLDDREGRVELYRGPPDEPPRSARIMYEERQPGPYQRPLRGDGGDSDSRNFISMRNGGRSSGGEAWPRWADDQRQGGAIDEQRSRKVITESYDDRRRQSDGSGVRQFVSIVEPSERRRRLVAIDGQNSSHTASPYGRGGAERFSDHDFVVMRDHPRVIYGGSPPPRVDSEGYDVSGRGPSYRRRERGAAAQPVTLHSGGGGGRGIRSSFAEFGGEREGVWRRDGVYNEPSGGNSWPAAGSGSGDRRGSRRRSSGTSGGVGGFGSSRHRHDGGGVGSPGNRSRSRERGSSRKVHRMRGS